MLATGRALPLKKTTGMMKDSDYEIVDLPGIYALSPYSIEERVTQEFLLEEIRTL